MPHHVLLVEEVDPDQVNDESPHKKTGIVALTIFGGRTVFVSPETAEEIVREMAEGFGDGWKTGSRSEG